MLYMFLTLDIRAINDIRLISKCIQAPSHELEDTETNTPDASDSLIADTTVSASVEYIVKYTIHKFSLVVSAINIHPLWLMDEKVRVFRIEVWCNATIDPTIADIRIM